MEDDKRAAMEPLGLADAMTRRERGWAAAYLVMHAAVLPLLLGLLQALWPDGALGDARLNLVYYAIGAAFVFLVLGRYLRRGFDALWDNWKMALAALLGAYGMDLLLSWGLQLALMALGDPLDSSPNNDFVMDLAASDYNITFALTVFLAPIVEEPLFRGAVFGGLLRRSRPGAYAASVLLFSLYHVWQYAFALGDPAVLLYAVQYVPVSIALAWCYERSGSIWVPIFFHMLINAVSLTLGV